VLFRSRRLGRRRLLECNLIITDGVGEMRRMFEISSCAWLVGCLYLMGNSDLCYAMYCCMKEKAIADIDLTSSLLINEGSG
jgi:3-deoxy-D-manno-octulosonic-acid transferase